MSIYKKSEMNAARMKSVTDLSFHTSLLTDYFPELDQSGVPAAESGVSPESAHRRYKSVEDACLRIPLRILSILHRMKPFYFSIRDGEIQNEETQAFFNEVALQQMDPSMEGFSALFILVNGVEKIHQNRANELQEHFKRRGTRLNRNKARYIKPAWLEGALDNRIEQRVRAEQSYVNAIDWLSQTYGTGSAIFHEMLSGEVCAVKRTGNALLDLIDDNQDLILMDPELYDKILEILDILREPLPGHIGSDPEAKENPAEEYAPDNYR
jgi:hypothetical protein